MRKIISSILITAMLLSFALMLVPMNVAAAPEGTPISDANGLAAMEVNGKYYLSADITLPANWNPITLTGAQQNTLTLDGNNHTITLSGKSLFIGVNNPTIKNLTLEGTYSTGTVNNESRGPLSNFFWGGVAGQTYLENVTSNVTITGDTTGSTTYLTTNAPNSHGAWGGLVGKIEGIATFKNCEFTGSMNITGVYDDTLAHNANQGIASTACVGGIVGHMGCTWETDHAEFISCSNKGTVSGPQAAGIVCRACFATDDTDAYTQNNISSITDGAKLDITDCSNTGTVEGYTMAGGMLCDPNGTYYIFSDGLDGLQRKVDSTCFINTTVEKCFNAGKVEATKRSADTTRRNKVYAGGIVAIASRITINECANVGEVFGWKNTGGILGSRCSAQGVTSSTNGVPHDVVLTSCINKGKVVGDTYTGGIVGTAYIQRVKVTSCRNEGEVISTRVVSGDITTAGGIIGFIDGWGSYTAWGSGANCVQVTDSVNTGKVVVYRSFAGQMMPTKEGLECLNTATWVSAGGIVGSFRGGFKITGCTHMGTLMTNGVAEAASRGEMNDAEVFICDRPYEMSTFPIYNDISNYRVESKEWNLVNFATTYVSASDNYYTKGSVDVVTGKVGGVEMELNSTSGATLIDEDEVWEKYRTSSKSGGSFPAFERDELDAVLKSVNEISVEESARYLNIAAINEKKAEAQAVFDSPCSTQKDIYTAADELRSVTRSGSNNNAYVLYIPEAVTTNAEIDLTIKPTAFKRFDKIDVTLTSANGFVLKNGSNSITYQIVDKNGAQSNVVSFNANGLYYQDNALVSSIFRAKTTEDLTGKADGRYTDVLTFTVNYYTS